MLGGMRHRIAIVLLLVLGACKDKPANSPPASSPAGSAAPTPTTPPVEPPPDDDPPGDPPDPAATVIARLCERDATCGCPIENCETFFEDAALPSSVYECFVGQSCETLCAKDSGAPGSVLYNACMKGKIPDPPAGTARKTCRTHADCPAKHECCAGACYQMGSSLWITACQMPSGKF